MPTFKKKKSLGCIPSGNHKDSTVGCDETVNSVLSPEQESNLSIKKILLIFTYLIPIFLFYHHHLKLL